MNFKNISVIIPVWNEEENINSLVESFDLAFQAKNIAYELIFIDDHSTDKTRNIIKSLSQKFPISVYLKKGEKGKAQSLIEGFAKAKYKLLGIIDGDLQYPPHFVPEMMEKIKQGADVVVANRKYYSDSKLRKIISSGFRIAFGKILFGLNHDVQSGLKVFKKSVLEVVNFKPASGWTFDLEFLHRATEAGFKVENYDITFLPRKFGTSKVRYLKTTFEIGSQAVRLKLKEITPHYTLPLKKNSMIGAGLRFGKKTYITHTTLPHHKSAIQTLIVEQKIIITLLLAFLFTGLMLRPLTTGIILVSILSFIYFLDVIFNLFLILKSLHSPQEISISDANIKKLDDDSLPIYSILCPLYHEKEIIPQFLEAVSEIDWPKDKLDLLLLLEKDDKETIEFLKTLNLPFYARIVIVPQSAPKTKPKACNYGLSSARGEYLVVYDAEDIPDPGQLKKAYLGFKKVPENVICLQAKLNYYNPGQNILTKLFSIEYSLWFDLTLTGLQALNTTIPLGGTSNHFRKKDLLKLRGWDPFNVTEDADLGIRLFKEGYKTAMIDSITLEEANSQLKNWLRQRSRWIKGYMQTYLVHMRRDLNFAKGAQLHSLIFQLIIGGKIAFILINPFLWLATFSYFAFYAVIGPRVQAFYPPPVLYLAVISLIFGNFMFVYYYMIGALKRQQWSLVGYVYLVPIYWILISVAGFMALYQLFLKPHYWEKTIHGLHLKKTLKASIAEIALGTVNIPGFWYPVNVGRKLFAFVQMRKKYLAGSLFIASLIAGNFLNFLFNAYLGRVVDLEDFAEINLASSLLAFTAILFGAFGVTVNHRSGFLIGRFSNEDAAYRFWAYIRRRSFPLGILITAIWFAFSPLLARYFKTGELLIFLLFGAIFLFRFASTADRGFLSARLMFASLALVTVTEPVLKFLIAFILVNLHFPNLAYSAIPLSVAGSFILGWILIIRSPKPKSQLPLEPELKYFPKKFFFVTLLSGLSGMAFLSLDTILAKHFLSPEDAGRYALVSLVGKMIYFMGGLASQFVMPLVSRIEGANKSSQKTFSLILFSNATLAFIGFLTFGLLGKYTAPILYGPKITGVIPYLTFFSFSMMCFTISTVFVSYYLAKKIYTFALGALVLSFFQIILISLYHSSLSDIVSAVAITGTLNLTLMVILHFNIGWVKIFENNLSAFIDLFLHKNKEREKQSKQSILIFNWRDIHHKWAGGAEVYIHEFAKRWVRDGYKVTLFCGNDGRNLREENLDGVEIIRRGGFYFVYLWAFLYYILRFRGKYDIIIDSENGLPFFTPLYAKEKKFLLIYHVHQEVFRKSLAKPLALFATFLEIKVMPLVYHNTQVITVSKSSRQEILKYKLTKTSPIIIHSGINLKTYLPAKKNHTPLVLYLGRLQYYKSLHVFIEAAKKVLNIIPNARFIIAGDGENKKGLVNFARKLKLGGRIVFLGKVTEEEKIKLYQHAWVFVNPSLMEGWGITTIEANACGTPVVASDVPGLRDSVKNPHSGYLVPWGDSTSFASNIIKLLEKDKVRQKMEKGAVKWAKHFDWEKSSKKFLRVFKGRYD